MFNWVSRSFKWRLWNRPEAIRHAQLYINVMCYFYRRLTAKKNSFLQKAPYKKSSSSSWKISVLNTLKIDAWSVLHETAYRWYFTAHTWVLSQTYTYVYLYFTKKNLWNPINAAPKMFDSIWLYWRSYTSSTVPIDVLQCHNMYRRENRWVWSFPLPSGHKKIQINRFYFFLSINL